MNARLEPDPRATAELDRFRRIRARMTELAQGLSAEDLAAQSMPDCSPGKWHLAHTSWFFEAMLLAGEPGYRPVDERYQALFNSYYEALGERVARPERGLMTRPLLDEVMAYRREIDRRMAVFLADSPTDGLTRYLLELGLHHDQQHQELFLMDLLHLMSRSPLNPVAYPAEPREAAAERPCGGSTAFDGGLVEIGADRAGFAFDNEAPRHRVFLEPFALDHDLVTNGDWIGFIDAGGYARSDLWLSDGWATVKAEGWTAPAYWRQTPVGGWTTMSLTGRAPVDFGAPVRHISFYEADAYARFAGKRLPTEAEWEHAAATRPEVFTNLAGEVWQWTSSAYQPYPGFKPTEGTAAEYNGKFMANQMVLRGGSFATPPGHARTTYRNFFYPQQRWAFMGLRMAADAAATQSDTDEDAHDAFRRDLIQGLSRTQKAVPPKWFYDAEGSRLFEEITRLPEYYPTRQETTLLRRTAGDLAAMFGPQAVLVEFGSGASEKTRILLDAAPDLAAYVPLDISKAALDAAATALRQDYPALPVAPVLGDFETLAALPEELGKGRKIGFFPGSTIGNLEPEQAIRFLREARRMLGDEALFILGVDLVKDPGVLTAAYDDGQGVTATFNRNLLVRANRELGADFDLDAFEHRAVWRPDQSRMEMHLRATSATSVDVAGRRFLFQAGETLHTESSRKFTREMVETMGEAAGWSIRRFDVSDDPAVALATLTAN